MNRTRAKELLPIIQAFAEGKEIQYKPVMCDKWNDCDEPEFNLSYANLNYRIKPEPEVFYVNKFKESSERHIHESKASALSYRNDRNQYEYRAKKFIEVIE